MKTTETNPADEGRAKRVSSGRLFDGPSPDSK